MRDQGYLSPRWRNLLGLLGIVAGYADLALVELKLGRNDDWDSGWVRGLLGLAIAPGLVFAISMIWGDRRSYVRHAHGHQHAGMVAFLLVAFWSGALFAIPIPKEPRDFAAILFPLTAIMLATNMLVIPFGSTRFRWQQKRREVSPESPG